MRLWLAALLLFLADYLTKHWIRHSMRPGQSIRIIPHVFHITYVENRGAAFSILPNATWLFVLISVVVVAVIVVYRKRLNDGWGQVALGLILGGAVGNLLDRLRFGMVTDFLDFRVWPVFNLADSGIVVGAALLFWRYGFSREGKKP